MSYVDSILEPGEKVLYRTSVSWTVYGKSLSVALPAFVFLYFGVKQSFAALLLVGAALAAIALALWTSAALVRAATEIAVTNRRIVLKRGLVRRHTVEMNMSKVESVDVEQTLLGRLFNYGDVTVRGVGSTFERLDFIDAPLKLRTTVTAG